MSDPNKPKKDFITADSIAKIMAQRKEAEHQHAIREEEVKEFAGAVNRIFSSPDGQLLLKKMIRYSGLLAFDKTIDGAKMLKHEGRKEMIKELLLPYLNREYLAQAIIE